LQRRPLLHLLAANFVRHDQNLGTERFLVLFGKLIVGHRVEVVAVVAEQDGLIVAVEDAPVPVEQSGGHEIGSGLSRVVSVVVGFVRLRDSFRRAVADARHFRERRILMAHHTTSVGHRTPKATVTRAALVPITVAGPHGSGMVSFLQFPARRKLP
jgi:hypothetical protein